MAFRCAQIMNAMYAMNTNTASPLSGSESQLFHEFVIRHFRHASGSCSFFRSQLKRRASQVLGVFVAGLDVRPFFAR